MNTDEKNQDSVHDLADEVSNSLDKNTSTLNQEMNFDDISSAPNENFEILSSSDEFPKDFNLEKISDDELSKIAQSFSDQKLNTNPELEIDASILDLEKQIQEELSSPAIVRDNMSDQVSSGEEVPTELAPAESIETLVNDNEQNFKPYTQDTSSDFSYNQAPQVSPSVLPDNPVYEKIPEIQSEQNNIADLESSIQGEFQNTKEDFSQDTSDLGIQNTFYSDLNTAMSANQPAIMSEILRKAEFEEKEKAILSPSSKKNLPYIIGAILLIIASVLAWLFIFSKRDTEVRYITDERVSSLVYSDRDLGINTTGLETFQTKSAIRKLVERKQDRNTLSQIYYVQKGQDGFLRRVGVKDIFTLTEAKVPTLLYDNIQHDFMHGVYTTDKNYPFIILKANSYDRAFVGMKEWEKDMIDDVSSYFDLPKEANDRSLLEDGFSDDLIKNKNVRVARYIPRTRDRNLLDFLGITNNDSEASGSTNPIQGETPLPIDGQEELNPNSPSPFENQANTQINTGGSPFDETINSPSPFGDVPNRQTRIREAIVAFLSKPLLSHNAYAQGTDSTTQQPTNGIGGTFIGDTLNQSGVLGGNEALSTGGLGVSDISNYNLKDVCFDPTTGKRSASLAEGQLGNPNDICFRSFQCRRVLCTKDGALVPTTEEGKPGVSCVVDNTDQGIIPYENVTSYQGRKSCVQFNDLLSLQSIDNMNLCFDQSGKFVLPENHAKSLADFYTSNMQTQNASVQNLMQSRAGVSCISPNIRYERLCVTEDGSMVSGVGQNGQLVQTGAIVGGKKVMFCFEPRLKETTSDQFGSTNYNLREKAAQASLMLRQVANIVGIVGSVGGFLGDIVGTTESFRASMRSFQTTLNELADIMWQVSVQDLLNIQLPQDCSESTNPNCVFEDNRIDILYKVASVTRRAEIILDAIRVYLPQAEQTEMVQKLREAIDFIKRAFGLKNNITWVTIGNQLPQGVDIYPGDELSSGPGITAVQQALMQLGLLDPLSATGTLDLVTQQAVSALLSANGLPQAVSAGQNYLSAEALSLLHSIVQAGEGLYGDGTASIDDFFTQFSQIGSFNQEVQNLQMILYINGYNISSLDGIFDAEVCSAVQSYQADNNLEIADPVNCQLSQETLNHLNGLITQNNYLGSGFEITPNGAIQGTGKFLGKNGPGEIDFSVQNAEAQGLREGDIILMYTFLDEETILITTHESVITEIIRRRSLNNIFSS